MSLVIPWFLSQYEETKDPKPLAWWIRDNLPDYAEVIFFPRLAAFNIRWYAAEPTKALFYDDGFSPEEILISDPSKADSDGDHSRLYPDFPSP